MFGFKQNIALGNIQFISHRRLWCPCVGCICRCQNWCPVHIPWVTRKSPAAFVNRQPPMESVLLYLCLFAGGQSVATRTFQKYRELVSQRVPIAHSRVLLKAPWNDIFSLPSWAFSLTHHSFWNHLPNILQYLPPNLCLRIRFWGTPNPRFHVELLLKKSVGSV